MSVNKKKKLQGSLMMPDEREQYALGSLVKTALKIIKPLSADQKEVMKNLTRKQQGYAKDVATAVVVSGSVGYTLNSEKGKNIIAEAEAGEKPATVVEIGERVNPEDYPKYEEDTESAQSFREAFRNAVTENADVFMFEGRAYNTDVKEKKYGGGKMSKKTHKMPDGSLMAGATHRETYNDGSEVSTRMKEMTVDGFRAVILEREIEGAAADAETNNTDVALGIRQAEEKVAAMSDEAVAFKLQQAKDAEMDSNMDIGSRNFQQNKRAGRAEGGSMLVPPEMEAMPEDEVAVEEDMVAEDVVPVDTYPNIPPEEMDEAMASQLPDEDMMQEYIDFVVGESLDTEEQDYLMNSLSADPQLSQIFDKVVETASEFSGAGEVTGPGSDVSDSIPARLSAGEFVMTKKATDQLGADNLQTMMDEAERAYDGGLMKKAFGGLTNNPLADEKQMMSSYDSEEEVKKQMITANQMPSIRKR